MMKMLCNSLEFRMMNWQLVSAGFFLAFALFPEDGSDVFFRSAGISA
jgi:hypothetical protein